MVEFCVGHVEFQIPAGYLGYVQQKVGNNTHHSPNKQSHCGRLQPSGLVLLRESTFFAYMRWEPGHQIKAHDVKFLEPD